MMHRRVHAWAGRRSRHDICVRKRDNPLGRTHIGDSFSPILRDMDDIHCLPLFLAVAEDLSFTAAARRLGLSRSAVGKAVARLEARLGTTLFQRTTRRVRLTAAGEILLERARA